MRTGFGFGIIAILFLFVSNLYPQTTFTYWAFQILAMGNAVLCGLIWGDDK